MRRMAWLGGLLVFLAVSATAAQSLTSVTCLLSPASQSDIAARTPGVVEEVLVQRSAPVVEGQLLVRLDDDFAQSELEMAEVARKALAARIARAGGLRARNIVSLEEMEQLRADLAMAEARSRRAELLISRTRITAPFSGRVAEVFVAEAEMAGNGPLLRLIDQRQLKVELELDGAEFDVLSPGDVLELEVTVPPMQVSAVVMATDGFIDPASDTFRVEARIDNRSGRIPSGASCRLLP